MTFKCRIFSFFSFVSMAFLAYVIVLSIFIETPEIIGIPSFVVLPVIVMSLTFFIFLSYIFLKKFFQNGILYIISLIVACFLTRFLWIQLIPTDPSNDFYLYYNYAINASKGLFTQYDKTYPLFPFKFGYPLILSLIFRVFGTSIWIAKMVNVVVSVITVVLIYLITVEITCKKAGVIGCFIYTFWPTQIMYTSVLTSEHMFILFSVASIYFFILLINRKEIFIRNRIFYSIVVGIFLTISQFIRPFSIIYLAIYVFFIIFYPKWYSSRTKNIETKIIVICTIITTYIICWTSLSNFVEGYTKVPISKSSSGFSFLVGTNFDSSGMYNKEDENILEEFNYEFKQVHMEAKNRAIGRIISYPLGFLNLMEKKIIIQWASENYGLYWSTTDFTHYNKATIFLENYYKQISRISQVYYLKIVIFTLLGILFIIVERKTIDPIWAVFLLIFLGMSASFILFEVQDRYHYPIMPFFIIIAAYGINKLMENLNDLKEKVHIGG